MSSKRLLLNLARKFLRLIPFSLGERIGTRKLLLNLARKYPLRLVLNTVLGFSGALFNGIGTTLFVPILLKLIDEDAVLNEGPPIIQKLLAPFEIFPPQYQMLAMIAAVFLMILLKNITSYASNLATASFNRAITADLQEQGLSLLFEVDLDFFNKAKAGDLMNRLGGEISRATSSISSYINLGILCITILVFLGILVAISWQLTIAATFILPLSTLITQRLISRSKQLGRVITNISQEYSGGLIEILSGIRLVKSTGSEEREYKRFQRLIRLREKAEMQSRVISGLISPVGEIVNVVSLFALVLMSRLIFEAQLDSLKIILITYLVVLNRLLPYVSQLNGTRQGLARSSASLDIVYDLMRRDNKSFMQDGALSYSRFKNDIQFENLSFAYPDSSDLVLKNINLTIPKGTTLALVGSSGAGKSTLADLLARFYDPTGGRITIDGVDLRDFQLSSIRKAMGVVSQDTFLFNNSIRNNIAYGCPDATDEAILDAIKRANAYEFIVRLPEGLDTIIGDRGVMLSGGQRQRLAIARALLKDPEILILDEATSALDTVSERLVQEALDELSRERTTLVIAHRLSTVRKAHQIAVLDRGQVVELGTHEELLQKGGNYSHLYAIQFSETSQKVLSAIEEQKQVFTQASYEFRAKLNAMMGSLSLLADGLVDTPEEQNELAREAYRSSVELFKTVQHLEDANSASEKTEDAISEGV
jgi:subfamily B ATP-binding cassette protein MsbA